MGLLHHPVRGLICMGQGLLFGEDAEDAGGEPPSPRPPESSRLRQTFRPASNEGIDPTPRVEKFRFWAEPEFQEGREKGAEEREKRRRKKVLIPPLKGPRHDRNLARYERMIASVQAAGPYFRWLSLQRKG